MDEYIDAVKTQLLSGIEARHWLAFFKVFQEQRTSQAVEREMARFAERLAGTSQVEEAVLQSVRTILNELEKLVTSDG